MVPQKVPFPPVSWLVPAVDVIGDIHGCLDALLDLICKLGYHRNNRREWVHPDDRRLVFLGDFTDFGPASLNVLRTVMALERDGVAYSVMGNHDNKLLRALKGNPVTVGKGLRITLDNLERAGTKERGDILKFLDMLLPRLILRVGIHVPKMGPYPAVSPYPKLVVAHAGIDRDKIHSPISKGIWARVLYGDVDKTSRDENGYYPRSHEWTTGYDDGAFFCVYGHTFVSEPDKRGNTINIDTGPVYGGRLTAFRWPEKETLTVFSDTTHRDRH